MTTIATRSKAAPWHGNAPIPAGAPRKPRKPNLPPAAAGQPLLEEELELLRYLCRGFNCMEVSKIKGEGKGRAYRLYERILIKSDAANDAQLGAWAAKEGLL